MTVANKNKPHEVMVISSVSWGVRFLGGVIRGLHAAGVDDEAIHRLGTRDGESDMRHGIAAFVNAVVGEVYKFFVTRSGLHVWEEFTNATPATLGRHYDLLENMTEGEIFEKFVRGNVFSNVSSFCAMLMQKLEVQWGGKEGRFLANGYANFFFVRVGGEVVVVSIYWHSDDRKWNVRAGRFCADYLWNPGNRAFSATAEIEPLTT
jgi:hypothetical protein